MWSLHSSLLVPEPRETVFPFFADAHNLESMTPPWLKFAVTTRQPIEMRTGAEIDYRLKVRGIPLRWRSVISEWQPPFSFVDEQVRGPYRRWHHRHSFHLVPGGTRIDDDIEFEPPGGRLGRLACGFLIKKDVRRIFEFRAKTMLERFGGDPLEVTIALRSA